MWIVLFISYAISLLLTIWGIRLYFNVFKYAIYSQFSLILAVFNPLSIVFLLPIDYVSSNSTAKKIWFDIADSTVLYLWKTNYWVTFLLTWLLLPVLQEFYRSGCYSSANKLRDALKKNLKFQLAVLAVSLAGVVYLVLEVGGLSATQLKLMVIALSHIYSLVLVLWLMGHGLVSIPRNKWTEGNIVLSLNLLYRQVPRLVDNLEDTKISFKEDIYQVLELAKKFGRPDNSDIVLRDWILKLAYKIPPDLKDSVESQRAGDPFGGQFGGDAPGGSRDDEGPAISRDDLSETYMTKLTSSFNRHLYNYVAYQTEFETLFRRILALEDVITARTTSDLAMRNRLVFRDADGIAGAAGGHGGSLLPRVLFFFHYYVVPSLNRVTSALMFAASFAVIESEFFHSTRFSIINLLLYSTGIESSTTIRLFTSMAVFSYMLVAALNSLTHLKVFNTYHLVSYNSDPVSACFYATYIARLTIPLSYNFITLFISRESVFESWFGKSIHLTGLFNLMNDWLPRLVLIPVILNLFNVYDRLKRRLGLSSTFDESWAFDDDTQNSPNDMELHGAQRTDLAIAEGRRTIDRELFKRKQRRGREPSQLEHSAVSAAANLNYENNRRSFHEYLASNATNRIDRGYQDDYDAAQNEDHDYNFGYGDDEQLALRGAHGTRGPFAAPFAAGAAGGAGGAWWTRVGAAITGLGNTVASTLQRGGSAAGEQAGGQAGSRGYTAARGYSDASEDEDDTLTI